RGPNPRDEPIATVKYEGTMLEDGGSVWESADGQLEVLSGEYDIGFDAEAEIRSLKDIRVTGALGGEAHGTVLDYSSPEFQIPGFEKTAAKIEVLTGDIEANIQTHLDLKKRQVWAGGELGGGGSVIEGELPFQTKQLRIPFTDWGISLGGSAKGSLLTAEAKAFAGFRFDPKRGFSTRCGAKLGAFLAGLGLEFELNIGPMAPAVIPMDKIITGSSTVEIGVSFAPAAPGGSGGGGGGSWGCLVTFPTCRSGDRSPRRRRRRRCEMCA